MRRLTILVGHNHDWRQTVMLGRIRVHHCRARGEVRFRIGNGDSKHLAGLRHVGQIVALGTLTPLVHAHRGFVHFDRAQRSIWRIADEVANGLVFAIDRIHAECRGDQYQRHQNDGDDATQSLDDHSCGNYEADRRDAAGDGKDHRPAERDLECHEHVGYQPCRQQAYSTGGHGDDQ